MLEHVLPRHLEIIYRINHDFLDRGPAAPPERRRAVPARVSLIDESGERRVRMARWRSSPRTRSTACRRCTPS
jgi:glycogen phosphorylase